MLFLHIIYQEHVASTYHMELTLQSLGFLTGCKKISKSPGPMEQLTIQSLGLLIGFQEDIKIPRPHGTTNHTVIRVSYRVSRRYQNRHPHRRRRPRRRPRRHLHLHLGLPRRALRVRANLRVLP